MTKQTWMALFVVMAVAVFMRFWNLDVTPPGLYPDEAMNGNNAAEALADGLPGGWKIFYSDNFGREGLFINIQSLFVKQFGNKPWALRFPSAIFGTLTVLGIFFLAELLFRAIRFPNMKDRIAGFSPSELIGLTAAFFTAISFWHINFSRIGFRAITAPFFLTWGLYFFFRFYKDIGSANFQTVYAALGGLLFGLGAHSYIAYRIAPVLLLLPIFIGIREYNRGKVDYTACFPCMVVFFLFFAFIAFLPLGLYYAQNPEDFFGRTSQISIFSADSPLGEFAENIIKTLGMFWVVGDFNWRHNFAGSPQLAYPVGFAFLVGLIASLKKLFSKKPFLDIEKFAAVFLLLWFGLLLLPVVISSESLPHALRSIITVPPVMILAAYGLWKIMEKAVRWIHLQQTRYPENEKQLLRIGKEGAAILILIFIWMTVSVGDTYLDRWANKPWVHEAFAARDWSMGQHLSTLSPDAEKYIVVLGELLDSRIVTISAQSVLFGTGTFLPQDRAAKNFFYVTPQELEARFAEKLPEHAYITFLKEDNKDLVKKLLDMYPEIKGTAPGSFVLLELKK